MSRLSVCVERETAGKPLGGTLEHSEQKNITAKDDLIDNDLCPHYKKGEH